ncbi:hypothetical protein BC826DRAFT_1093568 [Russula brevipes]|nr:hypothetical protein BC826DRAFT_1093568 [Russula brevipes]
MVAVSSPAKVLVTGANGYLATWVVKSYLEAGYSVRGTVRSLARSAFLKDRFGHYGERFELVVVEDIARDGAFDEAVKGVDAIAHTASPFNFTAAEPDDLIVPAVRGTTSILKSAMNHGSAVKRVVLTSSVGAIREAGVNRVFTESDWNDASVDAVNAKGSEAGPLLIYLASKTLAERAAWQFVATHKSEISWDLVALNPPYISGPAPTIDDINTSQRQVYDTLSGTRTGEQLKEQSNWVHVSVVAQAHVRATHAGLSAANASSLNQVPSISRNFVSWSFSFLCRARGPDVMHEPSGCGSGARDFESPRGEPGSTKDLPVLFSFSSTKAEDLLGLTQITPLKDVVAESVADFRARGYPGFTA